MNLRFRLHLRRNPFKKRVILQLHTRDIKEYRRVRKSWFPVNSSAVKYLQTFRVHLNASQRTSIFSLYVPTYALPTVNIACLPDQSRILELLCTNTTPTIITDRLSLQRCRYRLTFKFVNGQLFFFLRKIPIQHLMSDEYYQKSWFFEEFKNGITVIFLLSLGSFQVHFLQLVKQMIVVLIATIRQVQISEFAENLNEGKAAINVWIDFFDDFLKQVQTPPVQLLPNNLIVESINFRPQIWQDRPDKSSLQCCPFSHLWPLVPKEVFGVSGMIRHQGEKIFQEVNNCGYFWCPVPEGYQGGVCIYNGVDEVADASSEILLHQVDFQVLEEMQFVFVLDNAFHTIILHHNAYGRNRQGS